MIEMFDLYRAQFKITIAEQFQYRGALVIWMLGLILEPVIYLSVWSAVARSQGGAVDNFTAADFAAYYLVAMLVDHATFTWIMFEMEWWIRQGTLSPLLVRPVHPVHRHIANNLTFKLLTMAVVLPVVVILAIVLRPNFTVTLQSLLLTIPAIVMAMGIRFAIEWMMASTAFWVTRVTAINQVFFVAFLFLSGFAVPLQMLPTPVQTLAQWLPFYRMLGFPVDLLLNRLSPQHIIFGFVAQFGWLAIALLLVNLVWSRGVRQYSAVGA